MSTLFHPQTDGQMEHANQDISQIFQTIVCPDQRDWINKMDLTEFAINISSSATMGYAPFKLNGGHMPFMIKEICLNEIIPKGIKDFFLHHVPDCEDYVFEPHHAVHRLATSTKIEAGGAPSRTIAFSTKQITDFIMSDWANQFRLSQYVGQHFMYPRWSVNRQDHAKAKCMAPSHLKGGTWLKDVGHSSSLIAQMVRGLTSHAPIGHYRKQFKVGNQDESCPHCEGGPSETFRHVLFKCLKHPTWPPDMPNFTEATPYWEHFGKFIMDNPTAYAFVDSPAYSQTVDHRTRMVARWAKGAPTSTRT